MSLEQTIGNLIKRRYHKKGRVWQQDGTNTRWTHTVTARWRGKGALEFWIGTNFVEFSISHDGPRHSFGYNYSHPDRKEQGDPEHFRYYKDLLQGIHLRDDVADVIIPKSADGTVAEIDDTINGQEVDWVRRRAQAFYRLGEALDLIPPAGLADYIERLSTYARQHETAA